MKTLAPKKRASIHYNHVSTNSKVDSTKKNKQCVFLNFFVMQGSYRARVTFGQPEYHRPRKILINKQTSWLNVLIGFIKVLQSNLGHLYTKCCPDTRFSRNSKIILLFVEFLSNLSRSMNSNASVKAGVHKGQSE